MISTREQSQEPTIEQAQETPFGGDFKGKSFDAAFAMPSGFQHAKRFRKRVLVPCLS